MNNTSQKTIIAILAAASLVCIAFACRKVGGDLWLDWQKDEYSHGVIIPFISLLLAWHAVAAARPAVRPSWWGAVLLMVSTGFLAVGTLAAFEMASEYGFILALAALSLAFLGRQVAWVMLPAFVYLMFAVPLPHLVFVTLSQDLQLLSSSLGVFLLDIVGVPVFQEGNVIDLGGYKLQVAEACSGLRYLFPLMSFGFLVAYLLDDRMWKRIIVFLSSIPITIGMNALRIALVGVTVDWWGQQMAEGFLHEFEGWSLFIVCVALLMAEVFVLLRTGSTHGRFRFEYLGPARGPLISGHMRVTWAPVAAFLLSAAMAGLFGSNIVEGRVEIRPPHPQFSQFPAVFGAWHGRQQILPSDVLNGLQLSDYWLADYANGNASVNLYMAYYASQRVGSSTHSPALCIPGGGWQIENREVKTIALPGGESLMVSKLLIRRGNVSQLVYYWFDERGRDITENSIAKWYLIVDSIRMHRTDGALIRLVTQVTDSRTEAEKRLDDFLAVAYPEIKIFVPGASAPNETTQGNQP